MVAEHDYQIYLRRAAEVEAIAARISFPSEKAAMLRIAAEWRALARRAAERVGVTLDGAE
jgi:hypothetical protein